MDSLTRQLDTFFESMMERVDPATAEVLKRAIAQRVERGIGSAAPKPGEPAPDFTLLDQCGRSVSLGETLRKGPVVLVFFRGGWCPFCTLALRALAKAWPQLRRAGGQVLAVSPAGLPHCQETADCSGLPFPVLSDRGNVVARLYKLVYELEPEEQRIYARFGHDLPTINGMPGWELPIPAAFVIAQDGRVVQAHVDPRVNRRLEPKEAIAAVDRLAHPAG